MVLFPSVWITMISVTVLFYLILKNATCEDEGEEECMDQCVKDQTN
jgi:hypothetical protein